VRNEEKTSVRDDDSEATGEITTLEVAEATSTALAAGASAAGAAAFLATTFLTFFSWAGAAAAAATSTGLAWVAVTAFCSTDCLVALVILYTTIVIVF